MTLAENVGLPLGEYTDLNAKEIHEIARLKLRSSKLGAWLDTVVDETTSVAYVVALGYHVPRRANGAFVETKANEGTRTEGHAHKLSAVPEAPLVDLARAGLTPEELGEVPPAPPPVNELPDDPGEARFANLDLD